MTVLFVYVAADLFAGVSSPLQKRVQCVEAFKAPSQDFFVGQSLLCPTFENTIDPDRFNSLKSGIVQIGVVDHLTNLRDHFVRDRKTPHERLESAVVAMVRELSIKHVKWDRARHSVCTWSEYKLRLPVNELGDQPCRSHSVDLRARARQPCFALVLFHVEHCELLREPLELLVLGGLVGQKVCGCFDLHCTYFLQTPPYRHSFRIAVCRQTEQ